MMCHRCSFYISPDLIFEGKRLPFVADGEHKFICIECAKNQPERLTPEDLSGLAIREDGLDVAQ